MQQELMELLTPVTLLVVIKLQQINWVSTVDRIDYSNDTATTAVKGPLNTNAYGGAV